MDSQKPLLGRRILVVEDQYFIADDLRRILVNAGAEVIGPMPSADQALLALDDDAPNFALLDINLGSGDAYPVARELMRRRTPFVFVTGYMRWAILPEFKSVPYVDKPFEARKIVTAVMQTLQGTDSAPGAHA